MNCMNQHRLYHLWLSRFTEGGTSTDTGRSCVSYKLLKVHISLMLLELSQCT